MPHTLAHAEAQLQKAKDRLHAWMKSQALLGKDFTITRDSKEGWRAAKSVNYWDRAVRLAAREAQRALPLEMR